MNTGAPSREAAPKRAEPRAWVLGIQTKLHRWATGNVNRRFDDLFNLVCDPATLLVAWQRVRGNKGARSAGVDGETAYYVETVQGVEEFLARLRADLKARRFEPLPVRERMIPKRNGKLRRLGIPTVRDRVVQAALKLVLEPIFEADFQPCSYGFRPGRRAQDAIAEIHYLTSPVRNYGWVLEGDIKACFDEIDHTALMQRVRRRIGDRAVLALVNVPQGGHPLRGWRQQGHEHWYAPRRDPLTAAGQCRPLLPRRLLRRGLEGGGRLQRAAPTPGQRPRHVPPRPLRGRLRGPRGRHQSPCRGRTPGGGSGTPPHGTGPVGGESEGLPRG